MWERVRLAQRRSAGDRLRAATEDILAERFGPGSPGTRFVLTLACQPDERNLRLEVNVGVPTRTEAQQAWLSLPVIDAAVANNVPPLELIACLMVAGGSLPEPPVFPAIAPSQRPAPEALTMVGLAGSAEHLEGKLTSARDVVLLGERGTRKTLVAASLARRLEQHGAGCIWLDLNDIGARAETIAWHLIGLEYRHRDVIVVINRMQANLQAVPGILEFVHRMRSLFAIPTRVLATGPPEIVSNMRDLFKEFTQVYAQPGTGSGDNDIRNALHWFACLRLFEIDPSKEVTLRVIPPALINRMRNSGLIRDGGTTFFLGGDQKPKQLIRRAQDNTTDGSFQSPGNRIWEYLKLVGQTHGRATLERLDLVGFLDPVASAETPTGSRYLAPSWDLLFDLGTELDSRCRVDPTWNGNVGAAVFAAEALPELGHREQWSSVAKFIRERWSYQDGALPEPDASGSEEGEDFLEIRRRMQAEDRYLLPWRRHGKSGSEIDLARFHRTWMLGVLLGFEGSAPDDASGRIESLVRMAKNALLPRGYFYPRRVPWVTARVVLGLCRVGLRYDSDETVRLACDWLAAPTSAGGAYNQWWNSGTGSWNRDEATTAMCVAALIRAGAPATVAVRHALAWLHSRAEEWTKEDREIDLALALEAMLLADADWRASYPRVLNLLHWANGEFRGHDPEVGFLPEQALRAPFAAAQLATLVRVAVDREAAALLAERSSGARATTRVPGLTAVPGPRGRVRPSPTVDDWQQAAGMIESVLHNKINSRSRLSQEGHDPGGHGRMQLELAERQLRRCRELRQRLAAWTPRFVLDGLHDLGPAVCGPMWPAHLSYESTEG